MARAQSGHLDQCAPRKMNSGTASRIEMPTMPSSRRADHHHHRASWWSAPDSRAWASGKRKKDAIGTPRRRHWPPPYADKEDDQVLKRPPAVLEVPARASQKKAAIRIGNRG